MNCQEFEKILPAVLHGELDEKQIREAEAHVSECPLCALFKEREECFESLMRRSIIRNEAPFDLRERVWAEIEKKARPFWQRWPWGESWPRWAAVPAAVVLAGVLVAGGVFQLGTKPFPVFAESVSNHLMYLRGGYPLEIQSQDPDVVRQWFQGKLDFALHIPDLQKSGLQLKGARLCRLKDQKVAYLIFEKNGHEISMFVMDTQNMRLPKAKKIRHGKQVFYVKDMRGFKSILCLNEDMGSTGCLFVSTLPEEEIIRLMV